jgi:hypothetical protein
MPKTLQVDDHPARHTEPDDVLALIARVLRVRAGQIGMRCAVRRLKEYQMLLVIAIVLLVAWLLGFTVFHVTTGLIHVIVVVAVILFILHFFRGRRAV